MVEGLAAVGPFWHGQVVGDLVVPVLCGDVRRMNNVHTLIDVKRLRLSCASGGFVTKPRGVELRSMPVFIVRLIMWRDDAVGPAFDS